MTKSCWGSWYVFRYWDFGFLVRYLNSWIVSWSRHWFYPLVSVIFNFIGHAVWYGLVRLLRIILRWTWHFEIMPEHVSNYDFISTLSHWDSLIFSKIEWAAHFISICCWNENILFSQIHFSPISYSSWSFWSDLRQIIKFVGGTRTNLCKLYSYLLLSNLYVLGNEYFILEDELFNCVLLITEESSYFILIKLL